MFTYLLTVDIKHHTKKEREKEKRLTTHQENEGQVEKPPVVGEATGGAEQGICVFVHPAKDTIIPSSSTTALFLTNQMTIIYVH